MPACPRCLKPPAFCVCDRVVELATRHRVLVLQHPQEQDFELGTARLVAVSLPAARLVVGLSWASLPQALGEEADPSRWAALYPGSLPRELTPEEAARAALILDPKGREVDPAAIEGIVALDGSWAQAKALWWRNPWLLRLRRLVLRPREPSIYGRLRREPRREYLSTLESVAEALDALGEPPDVRAQLRRVMRTLAQRARDARGGASGPPPNRG